MIYPGYKFENLNDILLYSISKERNLMDLKEVYDLHSTIPERNIDNSLRKLEAQKLIKKYNKWKRTNRAFGLNLRRLQKIKKILGKHWENGWEVDWEDVISG